MNINLGDHVKDTVSGFEGIAVARHTYLYGCHRISVQPQVSEGKLPDPETFDEPQLEIIKSAVATPKETPSKSGGPAPCRDVRRY